MKKILFSILAIATIWSCGKDDSPETPTPPTPTETENSVPVIAAKTFTVVESISDTEVIGKVTATDADDDTLTFTIATNDGDLFEITSTGDLSLASGKTLDAATKEQHAITVKVDDGEDTANATITIKVTAVAPTNQDPEMADQEFTPKEDIADTDEIGQVMATDADEDDTLTFELTANDNDLFAVSESGVLTLTEGKTLDYETATSHSITVSVTDGEKSVEATMTITVEDVAEADPNDKAAFVTTWKTKADGEEIIIGANKEYNYNFTINWGDGTIEQIVEDAAATDGFSHTYETAETYTVSIVGEFPSIKGYEEGVVLTPEKLISVEQWGYIEWKSFYYAFAECANMVFNATDAPNLSNVTSLESMFTTATSFNSDLNNWNTSSVTDMDGMFDGATSFNGDISGWDTSNVTNMSSMFNGATSFNRDVSGWDISKVIYMTAMFSVALSFDQNLGDWDISSVDFMGFMLDNSGMSAQNFSNTLIGWAAQEVKPNLTLGAAGVNICVDGLSAYNTLVSEPNNWTITYNASVFCN